MVHENYPTILPCQMTAVWYRTRFEMPEPVMAKFVPCMTAVM